METQKTLPLLDVKNQAEMARDIGLGSKVLVKKGYISSIWSFPDLGVSQLYRWYGTLPRGLVERLLSLYAAGSNARVLDPFMGVGTTLDIAADAHLHATGIDGNPLACLVAEARLGGVPPRAALLEATNGVYRKLRSGQQPAGAHGLGVLASDNRYTYTRKWFLEDSLNAVLELFLEIADIDDIQIQRLLFVAAAQTVREVACVDARCTHHLVTKRKPFIDPLPLWQKRLLDSLGAVRSVPADPALVSVTQGSALALTREYVSADFALIHPPYLGRINYHLLHRLATDILDITKRAKSPATLIKYDFDYASIKKADVSTDSSQRYQAFVESLASVMRPIIAPGGRCAVVIGDQRHKGHLRHPFTEFVRSFEDCGFALEENFIWILQNTGGRHVLRRGHFIDHNYILVFHNQSDSGG